MDAAEELEVRQEKISASCRQAYDEVKAKHRFADDERGKRPRSNPSSRSQVYEAGSTMPSPIHDRTKVDGNGSYSDTIKGQEQAPSKRVCCLSARRSVRRNRKP